MFGLFKKYKKSTASFGSLITDVHSHILPGIDDGAQDIDDSINLAKRYVSLGFKKVIATPHVMADYFKNTPEKILKSLDVLRNALLKENITLEVEAAAEYYLDETFTKLIENKQILTFGDNYVLFELSYINMPKNLDETINSLLDAGYKPVLAHPERYNYFHAGIENYQRIKEMGCELQLNTISLTGYYGKHVRKAAEELVEERLISFLGSDMHHLKHADALNDAVSLPIMLNLVNSTFIKNQFI
ncbi:tyrosine-protein phosphatase [Pedobacter flavus]|uniref:protein-tyrosine-phosphatase n=1 Tax=Pedobacter flavus TaxID=3113906 RepID=A0ABU7GYN0_9SPHI|nr:CpsB/CapC family capsule biosynthesis tyrosine phosphatase [Pedobacter sp. VNH31]MEE1883967.1 CpsB/CapC family capsule biosynthesis tyrosine phosphatase [Pedobacter sp. VNH31]